MSETTIDTKRFKVVFVGDCAVGKTCLLISFTEHEFDEDHVPTVIDNRIQKITFKDEEVILNLWDTAGQEDFDNLRLLSYPETDLFFVCFSVVSPQSLKNVKRVWMKEICETGKAFTPKVPCILVGTKSDLRNDERTLNDLKEMNEEAVTFEQAQQFAKENGFYAYRECSALTSEGIEEVIHSGIESKFKEISPPVDTTSSSMEVNSVTTPSSENGETVVVQQEQQADHAMCKEVTSQTVKCKGKETNYEDWKKSLAQNAKNVYYAHKEEDLKRFQERDPKKSFVLFCDAGDDDDYEYF